MENIRKISSTGPRDFFLYLLTMVTLYMSVVSLLVVLFEYVNELAPDKIEYIVGASYDAIRVAVSILIVAFPVYLGLTWFLRKDIVAHPEKREFGFRKFMLYMTIFLAAVTLIVDLIILVNNFLDGQLRLNFGLKVVAVLLVAGIVFVYYLFEVRRLAESKPSPIILGAAIVFVVGTVFAGFFIVGSPATQRMRRMDERRANDLSSIQSQIAGYWVSKKIVPKDLAQLVDAPASYTPPTDPQTDEPYEYRQLTPLAYELCATFELPSKEGQNRDKYFYPSSGPLGDSINFFDHDAGRVCFKQKLETNAALSKEAPWPQVVPYKE